MVAAIYLISSYIVGSIWLYIHNHSNVNTAPFDMGTTFLFFMISPLWSVLLTVGCAIYGFIKLLGEKD